MRVARSRRLRSSPEAVWDTLQDPSSWAALFVAPLRAAPKRVKLEGGGAPEPGRYLQVLRVDHSWTRYRIERWQPSRQVLLVAETTGQGQGPGRAVTGSHRERLILIPQGSGSEAEWTYERTGALLSRMLGGAEAWRIALDARLDAVQTLCGESGEGAAPEPQD